MANPPEWKSNHNEKKQNEKEGAAEPFMDGIIARFGQSCQFLLNHLTKKMHKIASILTNKNKLDFISF